MPAEKMAERKTKPDPEKSPAAGQTGQPPERSRTGEQTGPAQQTGFSSFLAVAGAMALILSPAGLHCQPMTARAGQPSPASAPAAEATRLVSPAP
ncbi:MAG: hypothetical protein M3O22_04410 [Pseudomonadota bacterium]|nr:hypothetical protein [Pseudomonadota bacterium]